jgi:hypothetical protein
MTNTTNNPVQHQQQEHTMQNAIRKHAGAVAAWFAVSAVVPLGFFLAGGANIVRNAAGIDKTTDGLGKFVNAADALVGPATIAMAAIAPLACVVGAGALMFGNRRGITIIGAALGTLIFVASVSGIVQ